jgi:RNA polymerase sporulation-specific sigma factor
VEFDDLLESGTVGFVKAINTFDPERGCAFSTYAVPLIFGEIRRFIRDDGMIKVSREQKRLSAILNAERERRISAGEDSGIAAVANACGVDVADASVAIFAHAPPRSLDEAAGEDGDGASIGDLIADPDAEAREFDRLALRMAIEKLEDSERRLIILRYFRDYSQVETARALGISQVKVSRMEKRILDRLRSELL